MQTRLSRSFITAFLAPLAFAVSVPATAQTDTVTFRCSFDNAPNDCGFYEQAKALPRAAVVNGVSRDGGTSVRLRTLVGDNNVFGSGTAERNDLSLSEAATGCSAGQEQWWAHSILFPDDYNAPPAPTPGNWTWGAVFDFHGTAGGPQPNFQINAMHDGLSFQLYAGNVTSPVIRTAPIGPTVKNVWYDFVYHVKWSSGSDGFYYAWVNGVQKFAHTGPTLYMGQGCYLKLANYHTPSGLASSVIHDRVLRGTSAAAVTLALAPPPPPPPPPAPPPVEHRVANDFNGDGLSDILWRNTLTGLNQMWFMTGTTLSSATAITTVTDLDWKMAGTGDFDGDGRSDILWRNTVTGKNSIWIMDGATLVSAPAPPIVSDLNWSIAGTGDFDGDGKSDILWRHNGSGQNQIWFMNGGAVTSGPSLATVADLNWKIVGVGDFNGDGKSDILWRHAVTGKNSIWLMNGATLISAPAVPTVGDPNWKIVAVGDFDDDGKSDILWRNGVTGKNAMYLMNGGTVVTSSYVLTMDANWKVAGTGDFDGDGKSDILWRNSATGQDAVFLMNGVKLTSLTYLDTVPLIWSMAPR